MYPSGPERPANLAATPPDLRHRASPIGSVRTWRELLDRYPDQLSEIRHHLAEQPWQPTDDDRVPAWQLYLELMTRISVAPLRYREGQEGSALDSLYQLFLLARKLLGEHGREAQHFAVATFLVFERIVRPFTAYWHGQVGREALRRQDVRRRFRRKLRQLQRQLAAFAGILAEIAGAQHFPTEMSGSSTSGLAGESPIQARLTGPVAASESQRLSLEPELRRIQARRAAAYPSDKQRCFGGLGPDATSKHSLGYVGLALSGGGIRSATFCLGVVQCLVRHGLFRDIDYLSTVSGGGYLGAFLSAHLSALDESGKPSWLIEKLVDIPAGSTGDSEQVRWLRNKSKYLFDGGAIKLLGVGGLLVSGLLSKASPASKYYREQVVSCYLKGFEGTKLSSLCPEGSAAPYHLLNATVNLPGSKCPELRGRRSDFFVFSADHVGSVLTGYCSTRALESADLDLDLATAMATSGAAISSHHGASTRWFETLWLSTTNLSLGKWLPNPGKLEPKMSREPGRLSSWWAEIRGKSSEKEDFLHLSDGGHLENLGLYELLRRRCKLIIAVDGEFDGSIGCGALIRVIRFAAIDLNVRIEIDLSELALDQEHLSQAHFAFGTIDYDPANPGGERGYLIYIKSSVTGNEPVYVTEYRSRNPLFPHQSTKDQLFDEDQFEAYRALGEHAASDLFGDDLVTREQLDGAPYRSRIWLEALIRELLPAHHQPRTQPPTLAEQQAGPEEGSGRE